MERRDRSWLDSRRSGCSNRRRVFLRSLRRLRTSFSLSDTMSLLLSNFPHYRRNSFQCGALGSMARTSDSGQIRNPSRTSWRSERAGVISWAICTPSSLLQAFNSCSRNRVWSFALTCSKCFGFGAIEASCFTREGDSWLADSQMSLALYKDP